MPRKAKQHSDPDQLPLAMPEKNAAAPAKPTAAPPKPTAAPPKSTAAPAETTVAPPRPTAASPEQEAKVALARRAKVSAVPGHLKLVFSLDLPREVAERLVARAIREGKNLDALVAELLAQRPD